MLSAEETHQASVEVDGTINKIDFIDHQRDKTSEGDAKPRAAKSSVKPSFVIPGVGLIVAALDSWITPKINISFRGKYSSQKVQHSTQKQLPQLPGNHQREITNSSIPTNLSCTPKDLKTSPADTSHSLTSSLSSLYPEGSFSSTRPIDYRPAFSRIQEVEDGAQISSNKDLDTIIEQSRPLLPEILIQPSKYRDIEVGQRRVENTNHHLIEEKAFCSIENTIENDVKHMFLGDLDQAAQIQRDRELAHQEAAAEAQQRYDQLVRMQREFDEESTRLRADREMSLAYARDVEEAIRVDEKLRGEEASLLHDIEVARRLERQFLEEEKKNQQSFEAAAHLANNLVEADASINADIAYASQLMEEEARALQEDHAFAEQLQADIREEESYPSDSSDLIDDGSTENYANQSGSQSRLNRRSRSPENMQRPATTNGSEISQPHGPQQPYQSTPSDGALAQALFAKEQRRYAEANERWKRDIQAWSDTNNTNASTVADTQARQDEVQAKVKDASFPRPEVIAAQRSIERDVADCALCMESIPKSQLLRPCKDFYCRTCLAGELHAEMNQN